MITRFINSHYITLHGKHLRVHVNTGGMAKYTHIGIRVHSVCGQMRTFTYAYNQTQSTDVYALFLLPFSLFNDNFNNVSIKHSAAGADKITHEMLQKLAKRSAEPKSNACCRLTNYELLR